jgi:hypothetical protein
MQDGSTSVFEKQPRVILTTPRLILRTATEPDIKVLWERVLGDSDEMRYVFQGVPMTFGFEQLNCSRLLGLADPQNGPSIHALKKLGMRYLNDITEPGRPNRSVFCLEVAEWRRRVREQRA